MSHSTNPFALGGWSNPHSAHHSSEAATSRLYSNMDVSMLQHAGPMSGYIVSGPRPSFTTYRFIHPSSQQGSGVPLSTLNSVVVNEQLQALFHIASNLQSAQPTTTMTDSHGSNLGLVEWSVHPYAQLVHVYKKQLISSILQVRSHSVVATSVLNKPFQWVRTPGDPHMYFYDASCMPAELLAIITPGEDPSAPIVVSVSPVALQQGLLSVIFFTAALLLSGRRLD